MTLVLSNIEERMIGAINKYRSDRALPPMTPDSLLMDLARQRVMVFDHHAFGMWSWEHAAKLGFKGICTDNLAQGYESPEAAVGDSTTGWGTEGPRSVGHDMQMKGYRKVNGEWINEHFDIVGVAEAKGNDIAIFGRLVPFNQYSTKLICIAIPIKIKNNSDRG